uniref:Uncharacterized protein n=1 Tax=viral metagenome TaxID=1070528 RepID=A0A6C0JY66_9ZZZZ
MKLVSVTKSSRPKKKLMAIFLHKGKYTTVHFGGEGYNDYTKYYKQNKVLAEEMKRRYLIRHTSNENWNDVTSAGALSRWILWNKPTITASINDFKRKYNL